jgi:hypothetical protein
LSQSIRHGLILKESEETPLQWRWLEECFSSYLLGSLLIGTCLWLSVFSSFNQTLNSHLILPSFFLASTFYGYQQSAVIYATRGGKQYIELILFSQLLSLLLMGISQVSVGAMMMSLIPFGIMVLWSFVNWHDDWKTLNQHFILLSALVCVLVVIFVNVSSKQQLIAQDSGLMFLLAFTWLALSIQSFLKSVKGLGSLRFENNHHSKKDQYFFHDCINHLVGIKLFLSTRSEVKKPDMNLLLREVDLFESLLYDHFKLSHRNLHGRHQHISCQDVPELYEMLMESFLAPRGIQYELAVSPDFNWDHHQLPLAPLQRIGSNLIKNAVDHGGEKVLVYLSKSKEEHDVLLIKVVTQLHSPLSSSKKLEEDLSRRILEINPERSEAKKKDSIQGLGLDSVTTLLESLGGEMSLEITSHEWINHLKIPVNSDANILKRAA